MSMTLCPYLNFRGNAREAMERYREVFGGELMLTTFAEGGTPGDPAEADNIMHGQLETPDGFTLMGADAPDSMSYTPGSTISVSLFGDDEEKARRFWDALLDGGSETVPLERAPWGDVFGMLVDRFGIEWMVNVSAPGESA